MCSLQRCRKELVGAIVGIGGEEDFDWPKVGFDLYKAEGAPGGVLLHPMCFLDVFQELIRQEGQTYFTIIIAPIGEIRAAMLGK